MTPEALYDALVQLVDSIQSDPRWELEKDTFGVTVLGMILYGYALALGRIVMLLDLDDIDATLIKALVDRKMVATKWGTGMVAEARASSFDKSYHPGQFALIGVGHSYLGADNPSLILDNIFANLQAYRQRATQN